MRRKREVDVLRIIVDFQKNILSNKPTFQEMLSELQMMHFRVRPVEGDISLLNLEDSNLIEVLWNLGKLDELFKREKDKLTNKDKEVFFRFLDELYEEFQEKLGRVSLKNFEESQLPSSLEMEVFREDARKGKLN